MHRLFDTGRGTTPRGVPRALAVSCASLVLVLASAGIASATTLAKVTVEQMAETAKTVAIVRIGEMRSHKGSGGGIVTDIDLDVKRTLKGTAPDEMQLPGGTVDGVTRGMIGGARFTPGEECMVFLDESGLVVGGFQGKVALKTAKGELTGVSTARLEERVLEATSRVNVASSDKPDGPEGAGKLSLLTDDEVKRLAPRDIVPGSGAVRPSATRLHDSFENDSADPGLTGWTLGRADAASNYFWDSTGDRSSDLDPSWGNSAFCCGQNGTGSIEPWGDFDSGSSYANGMQTYMDTHGISLVGAKAAYLDFDYWMDTESKYDYFGYIISPDGGVNWYWYLGSGYTGGWLHERVNLAHLEIPGNKYIDLRGRSNVIVSFVFTSNQSNLDAYEGAYVDNVAISDAIPTISDVSPSSAAAGIGQTIDISGSGFGDSRGLVEYSYKHEDDPTGQWEDMTDWEPRSWSDTLVRSSPPVGFDRSGHPGSADSGPMWAVNNDMWAWSNAWDYVINFGWGGTRWEGPVSSVHYRINAAGVDSRVTQINNAAASWTDASRGDYGLVYDGTCTTVHGPDPNDVAADGHNDLYWVDTLPDHVIAASWWTSDSPDGLTLLERDIEFNDRLTDEDGNPVAWGDADVTEGVMDVETITLHELGHWVELRDLYGLTIDEPKIMFGYGEPDEAKRELRGGDIDGVRWVYDGGEAPHERAAERVSGADRYAVAVGIAKKAYGGGYEGVTDVIIASGEDRAMADALSASGLAGAMDAPVLTTPYASLPSAVRAAVQAMAPVNVHIVGGTGSVSNTVRDQLNAANGSGTMERIAGADRYSTAAAIAARTVQEIDDHGGGFQGGVFIANGNTPAYFTDALVAGPLSARNGMPILLAQAGTTKLPGATRAALTSLGVDRAVVVGNSTAVPGAQLTWLQTRLTGGAERIANYSSRYDRAIDVADYARDNDLCDVENMFVGAANKLPDALTGGAAVGKQGGVLVYIPGSLVYTNTWPWMWDDAKFVDGCWVFGGTGSVPVSVLQKVELMIQ